MTRTTNARVAGFTFLIYFAAGIASLMLGGLFGGARAWSSSVTWAVWLPLLVFELTLALWLITKGVAMPAQRQSA